jgi:hypothetical protein
MCWRFCRMSELLRTYQIGATKVEVWEDNVRTLLSPQLVVVAADTNMRRCIDHELAHTWLAHFYTGAASATMLRKAVEVLGFTLPITAISDEQVALEEHIVLAYCRGLLGFERPWDEYAV